MILLEVNTVAAIIGGIGGLVAAIIAWWFQSFLIPRRDYYTKSSYAIFMVKLGASLTAMFFVGYFIYIAINGKWYIKQPAISVKNTATTFLVQMASIDLINISKVPSVRKS